MTSKPIALLAVFGLLFEQAAEARQKPSDRSLAEIQRQRRNELAWSELAAILTEKKISTKLPTGLKLEGDVLAVRPDSLVMDVHKTSNRKLQPKGQAEIPRDSITSVRLLRNSGPMKAVGGAMGGVGGASAVTGLGIATDSAAVLIPGLILIIPLAIVGGYYLGKLGDRRSTLITIRPDAPALAETENQ